MIFPGLNLKYSYLKQYIQNIKKLLKRQKKYVKSEDDLFAIKQSLDKSDYYLKQIPKDKNNMFRVFADALTFSHSNFKEVKVKMYEFIEKNTNIFTKLLKFIGSKFEAAEEYLEALNRYEFDAKRKASSKEPEVALTILSIIYQRNLVLLYSDENFGLKKYKIDFGFSKVAFISILNSSTDFDTVYQKENLEVAQSIIYDTISSIPAGTDANGAPVKTENTTRFNYK